MSMEKISPNPELKLKPQELKLFYSILLLYESTKGNAKGYNISNTELKKFLKDKKITLTYGQKIEIVRNSNNKEIQFKDNKNSAPASLLAHLRHAFAHGYIAKEGNLLHFQNTSGKCVMDGKMTFSLLKELVETILKTKKEQ